MSTTVHIKLALDAQGLAEAEKSSGQIHKNLKGANDQAQKLGGSPGSRKVANSVRMPTGGYDQEEQSTYRNARAGAGTGAAGRDFAKQSQGLGGLVHLYATFAANLFAVSAAFIALSKAADTTNMVKGLDQLGAAAGRNLGTLAKQITKASDGAISLRDAMTATAQASAGGMNNKEILQMTEVAKKASQALGVAMPDALSRLSRGITKLEPELLDELGILVRVDAASQKYAASLGKSAASLTEVEKRQAFTNAVLEQGIRKFGEIEIAANPYDRLLASLQNLLQTGLEFVNKVLSPVVGLLASSPMALAGVIALIGKTLLSQAIPALTSFKQNAEEAAIAAGKQANDRSKAAEEVRVGNLKKVLTKESALKLASARAEIALVKKKNDELADISESFAEHTAKNFMDSSGTKANSVTGRVLNKPSHQVSDEELKKLDQQVLRASNKGNVARAESLTEASSAIRVARDEHRKYFHDIEVGNAKITKLEAEASEIQKKASSIRASRYTLEGQQLLAAEKANVKALSTSISAAAAEKTRLNGVAAAWRSLNTEIKAAKTSSTNLDGNVVPAMGAVTAGMTRVSGAVNIATTAIGIFGNLLSKAFFYVGIFVTAYQMLDSFFGSNSKEASAFTDALDTTASSSKLLEDTLSRLEKLRLNTTFDAEGIVAYANAMGQLTNDIENVATSFRKVIQASSGWDGFWDGMWDIIGKGRQDKLADTLGDTVGLAMSKMPEGPAKAAYAARLKSILSSSDITSKGISKAIDKAGSEQKAQEMADAISLATRQVSESFSKSSESVQQFKATLTQVDSAINGIYSTLAKSSPMRTLGEAFESLGTQIAKSMDTPTMMVAQISEVLNSPKSLQFMSVDEVSKLTKARVELTKLLKDREQLQKNISEKQSAPLVKYGKDTTYDNTGKLGKSDGVTNTKGYAPTDRSIETSEASKRASSAKQSDLASLEKTNLEIVRAQKDALDTSNNILLKGQALQNKEQSIALGKIAATLSSSILSGLSGVGAAALQGEAKQKELDLQAQGVSAMLDLVVELGKNTLMLEKQTLENGILYKGGRYSDPEQVKQAKKRLDEIAPSLAILTAGVSAKQSDINSLSPQAREAISKPLSAISGGKVELSQIAANKKLEALNTELKAEKELVAYSNKKRDNQTALLDIEGARNNLISAALGADNEHSILAKFSLESRKAGLAYEKESVILANELVETKRRLAADSKLNTDKGKSLVAGREEDISAAKTKKVQEDILRAETLRIELSKAKFSLNTKSIEQERALAAVLLDTAANRLVTENASLDIMSKRGTYSESFIQSEQANLAISKQEAENASKVLAIQNEAQDKKRALNQRALEAEGGDLVGITRELQDVEDLRNAKLKAVTEDNANKLAGVSAINAQNKEISKQQELLNLVAEATTSLSEVFGELGSAIGATVGSLIKASNQQVKAIEDIAAAEKEKQDAKDDPVKLAAADRKLTDLRKKSAKDEINSNIQILNSGKKLFDEKSNAYKAIDAIEKAMHIKTLALEAEKLAIMASNALKSIGINIPAIYAAAMAQLGPIAGPIAATAGIAAFVGVAFGGGGGGGVPLQQSDYAGTGQRVGADGKLGDNNTGVIGDSKAMADSIGKSIELLGTQLFQYMGNLSTAPILKYLKGIQNNTAMLATSLSSSLNSSDLNGNSNGTTGGISMGAGAALGAGTGFLAAGALAGGAMGGIGLGLAELGSLAGPLGALAGLVLGAVIGSIGLGTERWSQTGTGIKVGGTLSDATASAYQSYDVDVKDLLGRNTTNKETKDINIDSNTQRYLQSTVANFKNLLTSVGDAIGDTAAAGKIAVSSINIDVVKKTEETAKEFGDRLSADFSREFNRITLEIYPYIEKFAKAGEEFGSTAIRLIQDGETLAFGLKMVGKIIDYSGSTFEEKFQRQQDIIKNFGDSDIFAQSIQNYYDIMFTAQEKATFSLGNITSQLDNLGVSGVTSNAALKDLISTLSPESELYASLVKLVPAFNDLQTQLESLLGFGAKDIAGIIVDGMKGKITQEEAGAQLADLIIGGIYDTMANAVATQISQLFLDTIINPMITSVLAGATATEIASKISQSAIDDMLAKAEALAKGIEAVFNDPGFQAVMAKVQTAVSGLAIGTAKLIPVYQTATSNVTRLTTTTQDLTKAEEALLAARLSSVERIEAQFTNTNDKRRALEYKRAAELAKITDEVTKNNLLYAYALEDVATATAAAKAAQDDFKSKLQTLIDLYGQIVGARNTALQDNYTNAINKKKEAEKALNEYLKSSITSIRTLTSDLRKFLQVLDTTDLGGTSIADQLAAVKDQFNTTLMKARAGDTEAAATLPEVASRLLELSKATSSTSVDYARDVGYVRNSIMSIAELGGNMASQMAKNITDTSVLTSEYDTIQNNLKEATEDILYWEKKAKEIGVVLDDGSESAKDKYAKLEIAAATVITMLESLNPEIKQQVLDLIATQDPLAKFTNAILDVNIAFALVQSSAAALALAVEAAATAAANAKYIQYAGGGVVDGKTTTSGTISETNLVDLVTKLLKTNDAKGIVTAGTVGYGASASDLIDVGIKNNLAGFNQLVSATGGTAKAGSTIYTIAEIQAAAAEAKKQGMKYDDIIKAGSVGYGISADTLKGIIPLATGTNYVPKDMLAMIHEGEEITPKAYNPAIANKGNNQLLTSLINEVRSLTAEVAQLRKEQMIGDLANVDASKSTTRILRDLTQDGTAIQTKSV